MLKGTFPCLASVEAGASPVSGGNVHPKISRQSPIKGTARLRCGEPGRFPPPELTAPSDWSYHANFPVSTVRRRGLSVTMQHQAALKSVDGVSRG